MTSAWQEGATWNTKDGTNAWTTGGGDFDSAKVAETMAGDGDGVSNIRRSWQITKLVQGWVDGSTPDHGVMVKDSAASPVQNEVYFKASESTQGNVRPLLEVRWQARTGEGLSYTYDGQAINDRSQYAVNVANGNLLQSSNDVNIAGTGLDLTMGRFYNSATAHLTGGQFGGGATSNMGSDVWLSRTPDPEFNKIVYLGTGDGYRLEKKAGVNEWPAPEKLGLNADIKEPTPGVYELTHRGSNLKHVFQDGKLRKIRDRNNNEIAFVYDVNGDLDKITDTQSKTLDATVNSDGHITKLQDPSGRTWQYEYGTNSEWDLVKKYTDPNGKQTLYDWDGQKKLLLKVTTPAGRQTKFTYHADRKVASVTRIDNVAAQTGPTTSYAYHVGGSPCQSTQNRTVATDPRGKQTTYCADPTNDRVAKANDAKNHAQDTEYTPFGNVKQLTRPGSPSNSVSGLNWDTTNGTNRLEGGQSPTGGRFDLKYATIQDHLAQDYINPQGGGQRMAYDSKGNVTGITATKQGPGGRNDRVLEAEKATLTYNTNGTIATASDGRDNDDPANLFNTTWTYGYTNGNLTKVTPPALTGSGMTPALGATDLTYDSLSRVKTIKDGKLQTRTFTYDNLDRVTGVEMKNSAGTVLATETAVYDEDGNMTSRVDSEGGTSKTTSVEYDTLNRMKKETLPGSKTNEYTYDSSSNLTSLTTNGGDTVSYQYDDVNLVSKMLEPAPSGGTQPETVFEYDERNNRKRTLYPNGVDVRQTFFGDDTVDKIEAKKGTNVLRSFAYTYTKGGQQTDLRQTLTRENGDKTTYSYDHLDRLDKARTETSLSALVDEYDYDYDRASNVTKKTKATGGGSNATSYAYNQANQLCWTFAGTSTNPCGTRPTGATAFTYDANGNALTGNRSYGYNVKDQATSMAGDSLTYLGLSQNELTGIGSDTFQNNGLGVSQINMSSGDVFLFRRDPGGMLLGRKKQSDGARHYYIQDALGSTMMMTNSSGSYENWYEYEPYGSVETQNVPLTNPFKFAGGHDTRHGVYHFGARQYDPGLGRWTQVDPLDQVGDVREANRYGYVGGDPVNVTDPSGTAICVSCAAGSAVHEVFGKPAVGEVRRATTTCAIGAVGGAVQDMTANKSFRGGVFNTPTRYAGAKAGGIGCAFTYASDVAVRAGNRYLR
jgi:RHS repeat-associated protein